MAEWTRPDCRQSDGNVGYSGHSYLVQEKESEMGLSLCKGVLMEEKGLCPL